MGPSGCRTGMRASRRTCALAGAIAAVATAAEPAPAAPVTVVKGDHAVEREDPLVPPSSQTYMRGPPGRPVAVGSSRGTRAVAKALESALRRKSLTRSRYNRYRRAYGRARSVRRRLRGARRAQLGYVIGSLEGIAARGRLGATRMPPLFVQLERNTQYWPSMRYPVAGDQVSFRGSELLYQYYPGRGLQLQPLSTFKKANNMHGACTKGTGPCRREGLRRLLDEMTGQAVRRSSRFIAWEYMFSFGGGVHYLQYSFAPRLYIFNAFVASLLGLYDYSRIADDRRARGLFDQGEPEARREIPYSDTGSWSLSPYRGRRSTPPDHELLREVLQSMCTRRLGDVYCSYAARYRRYQSAH